MILDQSNWDSLKKILQEVELTKQQIEDLEIIVDSWYATHWRDDDNPIAEYRASREVNHENRCGNHY